ncbi:MAG TPA: hypothetical protein VGB68_18455, partial [Pyrinomonadaceae bacterium]
NSDRADFVFEIAIFLSGIAIPKASIADFGFRIAESCFGLRRFRFSYRDTLNEPPRASSPVS